LSQGEIFLTDRLKDSSWSLAHRQSVPFGRQTGQVIVYGASYWMASFRYENLDEAGLRALSAWIARRQGARVTFTAYRPTRARPASGASSNAGLGISAVSTVNSTVAMTGLAGALAAGDMLSYFTAASGYYGGEVVSAGAISSGAQTLTVSPAPVAAHGSPQARVFQALAEMQLEGEPNISEPHDKRYSVSFSARQVTR
jgi:hypothetical protein